MDRELEWRWASRIAALIDTIIALVGLGYFIWTIATMIMEEKRKPSGSPVLFPVVTFLFIIIALSQFIFVIVAIVFFRATRKGNDPKNAFGVAKFWRRGQVSLLLMLSFSFLRQAEWLRAAVNVAIRLPMIFVSTMFIDELEPVANPTCDMVMSEDTFREGFYYIAD